MLELTKISSANFPPLSRFMQGLVFFAIGSPNYTSKRLCAAIANSLARTKTHAAKAHKAFMFDPGGDSFFVEFYCVGRADVFAVTTGDAGIGYFEIIGIETFIDFDTMIKLCCTLSGSFSWLCFG